MVASKKMLAALVLIGTIASAPVFAQSDMEKKAQTLFDSQKYKECAELLEKEVQKPDASVAAIRLAMNANLRLGNPMTASIMASNLLKKKGTNDPDALYEAAQVAELAGDDKLALSRYLSYVKKMKYTRSVDARIYKAASYIIGSGVKDVDVLEALTIRDGVQASWPMLLDYTQYYLERNDKSPLANLLRLAFNPGSGKDAKANSYYSVPGVQADILIRLGRYTRNFNKDESSQLLNLLSGFTIPKDVDANQFENMLVTLAKQAEMDDRARFNVARRLLENSGYFSRSNNELFFYPASNYVRKADDANKSRAAKDVVALAPIILQLDTDRTEAVSALLSVIIAQPEVFSKVITPEQLGKLVAKQTQLMNNKFRSNDNWGTFSNIVTNFYKDDKKKALAFAMTVLPQATPRMAAWTFAANPDAIRQGTKKDNPVELYLSAPGLTADQKTIREALAFDGFVSAKASDRLSSALKNYMLFNRYDNGQMIQAMVNGKISATDAGAIMESVAKTAGVTPKLQEMADTMAKGPFASSAKLKTLKSIGAKGSDPVYTAAAKVFAADPKDPVAFNAAVDGFLKAYKGNVPSIASQAATMHELTAFNVMQWHKSALWNNNDSVKLMIQNWVPRMNMPGAAMDDFYQRAWNLDGDKGRKGGLFWSIQKHGLDVVAKNPGMWVWNVDTSAAVPAQGDCSPITETSSGLRCALGIIAASINTWSKDFFFKQLEMALNNPKANFDNSQLDGFRNSLVWNNGRDFAKYAKDIPTSTVLAFMNYELNQSKTKLNVNREVNAIRMARVDQRKAVFGKYLEATASRNFKLRLAAADAVSYNMDYINGVFFASKVVKPLLDEKTFSATDWQKAGIGMNLLSFLNTVATDRNDKLTKEEKDLKPSAGNMFRKLRDNILSGTATVSSYQEHTHKLLASGIDGVVKSGNAIAINRATAEIGMALCHESYVNRGKETVDAVLKATEKCSPQIRYTFLNSFTGGSSNFSSEMKRTYALTMSSLSKDIPGLVPVDKNDAAYNLFLAQQMKKEGNALQAWSLIREKLPLFVQRWKEFDFDFALWVVEQARKTSMFKEAMELGQTMWMDEGKLTPADAAKLGLAKGDVYRDWKSYPAAKIEYESLTNNARYSKTPAGRLAKFRLIELLILTQDYQTARTMLERLQSSKTQDDQAEAYYLQARIDYELLDDESAMQNLGEVFLRNSSHPEARLLQGMIMLRTNRLLFLELEIGQKKLATIAIPGKPIKLLIQDTNLSIIRGGKTLPVLVTTTNGKDRELVELMPNPQDPNKFAAELPTCLGKAIPNNMLLELNGEDEIIYQVDPKFQKENGNTDLPANHLTIRYPAKLFASSQKILSDEEQENLKMMESLDITSGKTGNRSQTTIVRPGSPIYVRVVDYDMSKNPNKPDSVFVDIKCSSGDELRHYELKETGDSTGVFEGKITTGIPFPNTIVSDALEGIDVNAVINTNKKGSWKSLPDGKRPKWLEIDSMTSCNFKEASINMPNPTAIKSMRVLGSIDKNSDLLATYPAASQDKERGGLRVKTIMRQSNGNLRSLQSTFQSSVDEGYYLTKPRFTRDLDPKLRGKNTSVMGEMSGAFYLPENMEVEFKFMQKPDDRQTAHLLIDDRLLISARMNATGITTKRSLTLNKGVHVLKVYFSDYSKDSAIQVGMLQMDGSYDYLPASWFSAEKCPELAEYLKPKGKITQANDGFKLVLDKALRYRKLRWVFEDFSGNQLEVTKATAIDDKGKTIVPCAQDLTSGKDNNILEVAAADTITVKYEDKKRIDDNKAILTADLSSSFSDAKIDFYYETIRMDDEGKAYPELSQAARVTKGDDIILMVSDPDENRSEEPEIVKAEIVTSSGEKLELELLENTQAGGQGVMGGTFRETFRIGDKTDKAKRTLKVVAGDRITARYLDKENNHPGIPFYRTAVIESNEGSRPQIIVYDTIVSMIEDRSPAALAKVQMMKNKAGKRAGDIKIFKEMIEAQPIIEKEKPQAAKTAKTGAAAEPEPMIVNSKAPLMLELICPELAKHAKSTAFVEVLTSTEINAAESERREQAPLRVEMPLTSLSSISTSKGYPVKVTNKDRMTSGKPLEDGIFANIVRLQLGSANDEINDLVSSSETFNLLSEDNTKLDSAAFKVPTVIVSGSDQITISYKNPDGKELVRKLVQLRSDGELELYEKTYTTPTHSVHLGQHFYVKVHDPDRDISPDRDTVEVAVASEKTGDKITLKLSETLVHSGIFTGSMKVELKGKDGQKMNPNTLWSNFGDKITFVYTDLIPLHASTPQKISKIGEVVIGSDGELAAFTKRFKDPDMAVKTNFLMAEALFEMAKSHKAIKGADGKPDPAKQEQAKSEIAKGKRVLEEALRDYPNTSLKAQGEFLLANLSEQLEDYKTAISQFSTVISKYPESEYAPKSYFQKAICYERMAAKEKDPQRQQQIGDLACEEFVRLTYLYPSSSLATDAKLRLGNYYYKTKRYRLAASVLEKFGTMHKEHPLAAKGMLLAGYACRRNEQLKVKQAEAMKRQYKPDYTQAVRIFAFIDENFKENKNERAEAMYFAGDSLYLQGKAQQSKEMQVKAYQFFQRLIWDYPEHKWAKVARGRMVSNPIKNTR